MEKTSSETNEFLHLRCVTYLHVYTIIVVHVELEVVVHVSLWGHLINEAHMCADVQVP